LNQDTLQLHIDTFCWTSGK